MSVSSGQGYIIKDGVRLPGLYAWKHHETATVTQSPPVTNTWYEVVHLYRCQLIWLVVMQENTETDAKNLQTRMTIDGAVCTTSINAAAHSSERYLWRRYSTFAGNFGFYSEAGATQAGNAGFVCAHDFKMEMRITSAVGTAQKLYGFVAYETLEAV